MIAPDFRAQSAVSPSQLNKSRSGGSIHPTRLQLLQTVDALLETRPASSISSDEVLELSGISRGSLYHHFEDLADLIDTALARRFSALIVQRTQTSIKPLFQQARTRDELIAAFREIARLWAQPDSKSARAERITLLARAASSPTLQRKIAAEQQRLSDTLADVIGDLQSRGLMRSGFHPQAASVLLQAWSFGLALDEVAEQQVDPDAWMDLIVTAFEKTFF